MGGDKEGAQLGALSHFEHKCEQRESVRLNSGASLIQQEVIFRFFSFSLAGDSDQSPLPLPSSLLAFQSQRTHEK